ncbi:MAG: hypothetical protein V4592_09270 [Bacteroidota bacterium]
MLRFDWKSAKWTTYSATPATWNPELAHKYGVVLSEEADARKILPRNCYDAHRLKNLMDFVNFQYQQKRSKNAQLNDFECFWELGSKLDIPEPFDHHILRKWKMNSVTL